MGFKGLGLSLAISLQTGPISSLETIDSGAALCQYSSFGICSLAQNSAIRLSHRLHSAKRGFAHSGVVSIGIYAVPCLLRAFPILACNSACFVCGFRLPGMCTSMAMRLLTFASIFLPIFFCFFGGGRWGGEIGGMFGDAGGDIRFCRSSYFLCFRGGGGC